MLKEREDTTAYAIQQAGCSQVPTTDHTITTTDATFTSTITDGPADGTLTVYYGDDGRLSTWGMSTFYEVYVYTTTQDVDIVGSGIACGVQWAVKTAEGPQPGPASVLASATPTGAAPIPSAAGSSPAAEASPAPQADAAPAAEVARPVEAAPSPAVDASPIPVSEASPAPASAASPAPVPEASPAPAPEASPAAPSEASPVPASQASPAPTPVGDAASPASLSASSFTG
jgi:hypothetical protein